MSAAMRLSPLLGGGDCQRFGEGCNASKRVRPALGGELAAREPVWDGEGWGCDRVAGSCVSLVGARGRDRGPVVAERDPDIGIALRLTLDEAVAGVGPEQD